MIRLIKNADLSRFLRQVFILKSKNESSHYDFILSSKVSIDKDLTALYNPDHRVNEFIDRFLSISKGVI